VEFYLWFSADEELAVDQPQQQIACQQHRIDLATWRMAEILDVVWAVMAGFADASGATCRTLAVDSENVDWCFLH
jgi:hypothetical protein